MIYNWEIREKQPEDVFVELFVLVSLPSSLLVSFFSDSSGDWFPPCVPSSLSLGFSEGVPPSFSSGFSGDWLPPVPSWLSSGFSWDWPPCVFSSLPLGFCVGWLPVDSCPLLPEPSDSLVSWFWGESFWVVVISLGFEGLVSRRRLIVVD